MALSLVALCLAAVAVTAVQAAEPKLCELVDSIPWDSAGHAQTIFNILNNNQDHLLTPDDLHDEYYLSKLQAAAAHKFIKLLDGPDADKDVDVKEIKAFLEKPQTKLAIYECIPVRSKALENLCLRDQLTNYVYLVLDDLKNGATTQFFRHLEDQQDKDEVITAADLKNIKDATTKANLLRELSGGTEKPIDQKAFDNYITHEDFGPHFRVCKDNTLTTPDTGLPDYKETCLTEQLEHFVNHHFTELDLASVFNYLDTNNDKYFNSAELQQLTKLSASLCDHFMRLLDDEQDGKIHYGEFRTLFRRISHYRRELSKGCMGKADQGEQEACFQKNVVALIKSRPVPRFLALPELDVTIIFEDLDKNCDGKIVGSELPWSQKAKDNFVSEVDSSDAGTDITLDEHCHYTKLQHIVFGIGDAMHEDEGNNRLKVYLQEYEKMMEHMLLEKDVAALFNYYESQTDDDAVITAADLSDKMTPDQAKYFLLELGMGDDVVTYEEFEWFVRQEELLKLYAGVCTDHAAMAKTILDYIENQMTEYDVQALFIELDADGNMELSPEDFSQDEVCAAKQPDQVAELIKAIDRDTLLGMKEPDSFVNILEWWLFFNTPLGSARKDKYFDGCASKELNQKDELKCYKEKLFDKSIY